MMPRGGERILRILILQRKGLSRKAAECVVDAAMYGQGCIPKEYADSQGATFTELNKEKA